MGGGFILQKRMTIGAGLSTDTHAVYATGRWAITLLVLVFSALTAVRRWTEEIAMNNGLMFDDFLQAVEWAEENILEDFEVVRQPDGRYLVRECE